MCRFILNDDDDFPMFVANELHLLLVCILLTNEILCIIIPQCVYRPVMMNVRFFWMNLLKIFLIILFFKRNFFNLIRIFYQINKNLKRNC